MILTMVIFFAAVCLSGSLWYLYFYRREKKLISRLQTMIDQAADGNLTRQEISEEKISALENSLKRYLDGSLTASENQKTQKKMIQELISDISHQTLTPVANLKIYTELLKEETGGSSEILDTIWEQTQKLDFLIQSLVKLSRMENGIIAVYPKETKISRLFEKIRQEYEAKAAEKEISFQISDTSLLADFDLKWTAEAVGNIVDNAIKYTKRGGHIKISTEQTSFFVRIDIQDDGIGIDEEDVPKIFSRFYRSFEVADEPGVGIGLYLAREIIAAQKGYVKVKSEKGTGTVFSVFLS